MPNSIDFLVCGMCVVEKCYLHAIRYRNHGGAAQE